MKTAVLICGKCPKDYKSYYDSINNTLIKPYNSDVFISTWTQLPNDEKTYVPEELWGVYKPKRISMSSMNSLMNDIEEFNLFLEDNHLVNVLPSMYPLFYKLHNVNQLRLDYEKKTGIKYDLIIRTRFDLNFSEKMFSNSIEPFVFDKILDEEVKDAVENDVLYLRQDPFFDFPTTEWRNDPRYFVKTFEDWIWDSFGFGSDKTMNIYCNTFLNMKNILASKRKDTNVNEKVLCYQLRDNNVTIKHTHTTYKISNYR